jgi:hypothetical protein
MQEENEPVIIPPRRYSRRLRDLPPEPEQEFPSATVHISIEEETPTLNLVEIEDTPALQMMLPPRRHPNPNSLMSWSDNSCWFDQAAEGLFNLFLRNPGAFLNLPRESGGPLDRLILFFRERAGRVPRAIRVLQQELLEYFGNLLGRRSNEPYYGDWFLDIMPREQRSWQKIFVSLHDVCLDCSNRCSTQNIFAVPLTDIDAKVLRPLAPFLLLDFKGVPCTSARLPHQIGLQHFQYRLFHVTTTQGANGGHFYSTMMMDENLRFYDDMDRGVTTAIQAWPSEFSFPYFAIYERIPTPGK